MRDFTQLLKNKFKSKNYFLKNTQLGYLPVQVTNEESSISNGIPSNPGLSPQKEASKVDATERYNLKNSNCQVTLFLSYLGSPIGLLSSKPGLGLMKVPQH